MKLHPRVTKTAVELVKRFEGLRRRAARLSDGGWTVGYGHTLSAREGAVVSPEEAELLLHYDLSEVATKIEAWTFTPLNQNQFEALTAFAFNIGVENFRRSTVLKRVNEGQHLQAAAAMELWRKSDVDGEGIVVDALVRRRAAEKAHYLTPPEGFRPSPSQVLRPAFDFSVIEAAAQSQVAQRAAVVDAPLEGEDAVASVETAPEAHAEPSPVAESATHDAAEHVTQQLQGVLADEPRDAAEVAESHPVEAEAMHVEAVPTGAVEAEAGHVEPTEAEPLQAAVAESAPAQALYAPEPHTEAQPVRVGHGVVETAVVAGAAAVAASPFVMRGFEPPPSRFSRAIGEQPAPANEQSFADATPLEPAPVAEPFTLSDAEAPEEHSSQPSQAVAEPAAEPVPEFNLFDRPLAPPAPGDMDIPTAQVRSGRLRDDDVDFNAAAVAIRPSPADGHAPEKKNVLQDRRVLFASVGLLGVALFAAAIFSMLTGKATGAHLLIGFLGVLLITPAGVYFLLRRMGEGEPVHE